MNKRPLLLLALFLCASALAGCSKNAATGKSYFMLLSREQENALGAEAAPQFTAQYGGKVADTIAQTYITDIGYKLSQVTESDYPTLDWEFTFLDSDVVNAFALPGGKVFVTRGLVQKLNNEAELAGVLGHEVGHVTAQHANRRISKQIGFNAIVTGLAVAVASSDDDSDFRKFGQYGVPALSFGGNIVLLKYGRDEELEADSLGMRYMERLKYAPEGQLQVMRVLKELSGSNSRPPELLSTHPYPERRIQLIQQALDTKYAHTRNNPAFHFYPNRFKQNLGDRFQTSLQSTTRPIASTWCSHCE